ncbi:hypothetical protein CES86_5601 [Brucella lupini]|uniref:Uncharacterized protein n=1 Tax=Brucella lupini TaxID=255457 RepID=A0A256H1E9_9HYPH|nr:hypothetical protein CES86_5601 [Brucella lupini]
MASAGENVNAMTLSEGMVLFRLLAPILSVLQSEPARVSTN